jgi:large subunit ribosomal protein L5
MNRLKEKYEKEVAAKLCEEFGIKNRLAVPQLTRVVVNMGVGKEGRNQALLESLKRDLAAITGQTPAIRSARVSVAAFNLRKGMPVGLKITLRKERMYALLDRLFSLVLPRLRDFRGLLLKSFDQDGNYTLGLAEQTIFPEIDLGKSTPHGLEITLVTNTDNPQKAKRLLELLGMPFAKE